MTTVSSRGTSAPPAPRFRYGWIVLAVSAAIVLLGAGTRAAPGALLLLGLAGPVSGTLIDRFGIRPTTVVALLLTAAGLGGSSLSHELWQMVVLFGLVAGFGAGLVSSSLGPVIANRWFVKGRGAVVGIFGGAASAGQLIAALMIRRPKGTPQTVVVAA